MISALPVSGAWQPKTIGAPDDPPRISFSRASFCWYSGSVSKSHAIASPPDDGQNSVLMSQNAIADRADLADRIAHQTMARRGPDYASEVRRLLDAGLDVMRACGTASRPRVSDIVTAAGLSNDAFYRHFASKDAPVAAILEDGRERLTGYLIHKLAKEATPEGKERRWVEGILSQATDDDIASATRG